MDQNRRRTRRMTRRMTRRRSSLHAIADFVEESEKTNYRPVEDKIDGIADPAEPKSD